MKEDKKARSAKRKSTEDKGKSSNNSGDQKPLLTTKNLEEEGSKKNTAQNRTSLIPGKTAAMDVNTDYKDLILEEEEIECSEEGHVAKLEVNKKTKEMEDISEEVVLETKSDTEGNGDNLDMGEFKMKVNNKSVMEEDEDLKYGVSNAHDNLEYTNDFFANKAERDRQAMYSGEYRKSVKQMVRNLENKMLDKMQKRNKDGLL